MQTFIELWRVRCSQAEHLMKIKMVYVELCQITCIEEYYSVQTRAVSQSAPLFPMNQYIEITHLAASKGPLNIGTLMT